MNQFLQHMCRSRDSLIGIANQVTGQMIRVRILAGRGNCYLFQKHTGPLWVSYKPHIHWVPRLSTGLKRQGNEFDNSLPSRTEVNPLNAELNPICHLLVLVGAHHILHVSGVRVKNTWSLTSTPLTCFHTFFFTNNLISVERPEDINSSDKFIAYMLQIHVL